MAENENQNELNKLEKDGRIDQENFAKENNGTIQKVARGKKHVSTVEQFVDMDLVMATAMENKVYLNMLEPCVSEGINLTDRIKQYFIDNKVKPSEIANVFQEEISKIRVNINKEVKGLVFDENGMIDVNKSIQEARQYGVDVAGCVGAIIEEEGKKFEIGVPSNVFNVTEKLDARDNTFYDELFKTTQVKLEEFSKNHNIDVILGESKEDESQVYKDFRNRFKNIKDFISKKLAANRNKIEKAEDVLKAYYEYQELLGLDVDSLEGISQEQKDELIHVLEELKDIFRDRFRQELERPDLGELSEEEILEEFSMISPERIREIKDEVRSDVNKARNDGKTGLSDITISEDERLKAGKIRRINLFRNYTASTNNKVTGTYSDTFKESRYYDYDMGKYDDIFFEQVSNGDKKLLEEADGLYKQDQFIDIYTGIIRRHYMTEVLDEFPHAGDSSDYMKLAEELDGMCMAINAAWIVDEYSPMGEVFEKDIEFKRLAMQRIKEVFPEVVFERHSEVDGLNEVFDAGATVTKFKERYKGLDGVDSIQTIEDLIQYTRTKANIAVKVKMHQAMMVDDSEEAKAMDELLADPDTLEEVRAKHKVHERIIVKEKRLTKLSAEVLDLVDKVNNDTISQEEEIAMVEKLAIILREYDIEEQTGMNVLYKIARENLALYLPNLYDDHGRIDLTNLDKEYRHFLHERGIDVEEGISPIDQAIEKYDKEIEEAILQDVVKRNAKQEAEQAREENIKKLDELDRLDNQERVLKFLRFAKKTVKNNQNEDITLSEDKVTNIENIVKGNIRKILEDTGRTDEEEKIFKGIDDLVFDEGMYFSMMREIRIGYAKTISKDLSIKYNSEKLTDEDDMKKILSLYLGTKLDVKNALFNKQEYMARQQLLINLLKKIDPKLVNGTRDVNDMLLLKKYNELFGEEFTTIEEAYNAEENRVLEEVIGKLDVEIQGDDIKVADKPILNAIRSNTLLINSNLQRAKMREEHVKVNNTLSLIKDVQGLLKQKTEKGLSKEDEIKLVKTLAIMVGTLKDKPRHRFEELTDAEAKFEDLRTEALAIAYDNIATYFPEVMNKNGTIRESEFEEVYKKYLEENGQELPDGVEEGASILDATVAEFEHIMEHKQNQELRINIEDATIQLMDEIDDTLNGFEQEKNETIYLNVIHTLRKLLEKQGHKNYDASLKRRFDKVIPGIYDLALETEDKFLIDDQYIDSLVVVAGKREMEDINSTYFPKGEKGRTHTKIEDIPLGEQGKIIQIAVGTILACEDFADYQAATKTDTKRKAVNLLSKFFDNVLDENGNLNKEAVFEQYLAKYEDKMPAKYGSLEKFCERAHKKLAIRVASDIVRDDKISSQYVSVFKNNALRYEIHRKNEDARVTGEEMDVIMERDGVELIVGEIPEKAEVKAPEIPEVLEITTDEIAPVIESSQEILEVGTEPVIKVNQEEQSIAPGFVVEEMTVNTEDDKKIDNHPVKVPKQNIFAKALGAFGKFVKDKIIDIKNNLFGETDNSTGEGTATTSTSSGGTDKTSQASVKNLTGYDPIKLKLSQSPAQEVDSSIEAKSNAGKDTEDLGEIEDF